MLNRLAKAAEEAANCNGYDTATNRRYLSNPHSVVRAVLREMQAMVADEPTCPPASDLIDTILQEKPDDALAIHSR